MTKNALKFTLDGSIKILAAYDTDNSLLKVSVIDNGSGINTSEMPYLFQMFGKLNRTASQNSEGLGMGLLICQHLVECNQGTIQVFSDGAGLGSTFKFSMRMEPKSRSSDSHTNNPNLMLINTNASNSNHKSKKFRSNYKNKQRVEID